MAFDRTCFSSPQNSASCSVAQGHTNPCVFPCLPLDTKSHGCSISPSCSTSGVIVEWQYQQVFDLLILRALILAHSSSSSGFTKETKFLGTFPSSVLFSRASALTSGFFCCCGSFCESYFTPINSLSLHLSLPAPPASAPTKPIDNVSFLM